jgi:hypothetical protein
VTGINKRSNKPLSDQSLDDFRKTYNSDPNFHKMADEYFKKTGDLLGTKPAAEQLRKLKKAKGK